MSADIYYTPVDDKLQKELRCRGRAGYLRRNQADLKFMLEKVANVKLVPYEKSEFLEKDIMHSAILGGTTVISSSYMPTGPYGYLSSFDNTGKFTGDRVRTVVNTYLDAQNNIQTPAEIIIDKSRRIPPYLRTTNITIADTSTGYLNDATLNIIIPNPAADLEFIESVYFRPGRKVSVYVEYPESAIISKSESTKDSALKTDGTLDVDNALRKKINELAKQNSNTPGGSTKSDAELKNEYFKMNRVRFDGVIVSFEWKFQDETMSIDATITVRGTSNVYTDTNFIINQTKSTSAKESATNTTNSSIESTDITEQGTDKQNSFWSSINSQIQKLMPETTNHFKDDKDPKKMAVRDTSNNGATYITLYWLIKLINNEILSKQEGQPQIQFDSKISKSNYFELLVSAFPGEVILPDVINRTYGTTVFLQEQFKLLIGNNESVFKIVDEGKNFYDPTMIFISLQTLQTFLNEATTKTVNDLLKLLSTKILESTGNAIELMLVTPPDPSNINDLLWIDKRVVPAITEETPVFSIPIGPSHPYGSIVQTLNMDAKLPTSVASLAYSLNSDVTKLNESDIAPFLSFMYTSNDVTRENNVETRNQLITKNKESLTKLQNSYKEKHEGSKIALATAKKELGANITSAELQQKLSTQLKTYITYPAQTLNDSLKIASPVIPIAVDFEIDGINGFRYGNIITFDIFPSRYKTNVVWQIINITHEISEAGKWVTKIKCQMRPKIT